jgi:hypothetical protein
MLQRIEKKTLLLTILLTVVFIVGCSVDIDPSIANTKFGMNAIRYEYIIVLVSILGGYACIFAGLILTILGFTDSIEWFVEVAGITSRLVNASPGILLMIIGLIIILKKRLKIKSHQ